MKQLKEAKELFPKLANFNFENDHEETEGIRRGAELSNEIIAMYHKKLKQLEKLQKEIQEIEEFSSKHYIDLHEN